jgi:hypothetical protein
MYTMDKQLIESKGNNGKIAILFASLIAFSLMLTPKAYAQGTTTLRDPLVPGATNQLPGVPSRLGAIPAPGSGPTSLPPPIGNIGPPTLIPSIPAIPATQIGSSFSGVGLPASLPMALPPSSLPGGWGQALFPLIPKDSSTPGPARPILQGFGNPAVPSSVMPAGGLPGTGGYNTTIPQIRRLGTSKTTQYELRERTAILGGGGNSQDEVTQFGPLAGLGQVYGIPTGTGYNNGPAGTNNDNFNKSIDLGGGMRNKIGNVVISTGKSVQDLNGYNVMYGPNGAGNGNPLTSSYLTTEFGQGARTAFTSAGTVPNRTTDFGFPLMPQNSLNAHPNEPGHLLPQQAVLTNF